MNTKILWWILGGAGLLYLLTQRQQVAQLAQSGEEDVTAALSGWQTVNDGPIWIPVINTTENQFGIPPNLLARMAYQESRFRTDVISGTTTSPAGALGILQLMPQFFSTVQGPIPFQRSDTVAQITQAAQQLTALYAHFGDWALALAGYNDGQANVDAYLAGNRALPMETSQYVSQILTDVPAAPDTVNA
jgi:soluble lytic murein transglycosylase-like protein